MPMRSSARPHTTQDSARATAAQLDEALTDAIDARSRLAAPAAWRRVQLLARCLDEQAGTIATDLDQAAGAALRGTRPRLAWRG